MTKTADATYEELHEEIANLRIERGLLNNKVLDLEAKHRDLISELSASKQNYRQLIEDSFKAVNESNRTIAKLVDKMDGGTPW